MNRDNVAKWVQALRSGEYEQTGHILAEKGKFCCLGVACEVAIKDGLDVERFVDDDEVTHYDNAISTLPGTVATWLGLDPDQDNVPLRAINAGLADSVEDDWDTTATSLNDRYRLTFEQIADAMEKEYLR